MLGSEFDTELLALHIQKAMEAMMEKATILIILSRLYFLNIFN